MFIKCFAVDISKLSFLAIKYFFTLCLGLHSCVLSSRMFQVDVDVDKLSHIKFYLKNSLDQFVASFKSCQATAKFANINYN